MNNAARLDRLSALLSGLAPRVQVMRPDASLSQMAFEADPSKGLWLHLVLNGEVELRIPRAQHLRTQAPVILVCQAAWPHQLLRLGDSGPHPDDLLCIRVHLDGPIAPWLLAEFEHTTLVPLENADPSLQQTIALLQTELGEPRCGQPLLLDRAGDILFIGLLRHLVAHARTGDGLFQGLSDPRLAATLVALHTDPAADWCLETMAERAGMSRTAFANRFRDALKTTPGKYLSQLRLAMAQRAVESGEGLKAAARRSGYANASALSRALSKARALQA
ncbi:MAG: AraC family transcriptional regulator [Burkholderiaceae bacterium]